MSTSYLPSQDAKIPAQTGNFVSYADTHVAALGVTSPQVTDIADLEAAFEDALDAHNAAQIAAKTARQAKDAARKNLFDAVRAVVNIIQHHPGVTDEQREALGITVPKGNKTPVPIPTARPDPDVAQIDELAHTLRIVNSDTNKTTKPDGVSGTEVWMKIVPAGQPAPVNPEDLDFAGFTTTSKFVRDFDGGDAGKTAYYRTRYINSRGEQGPWGNQAAATVAA